MRLLRAAVALAALVSAAAGAGAASAASGPTVAGDPTVVPAADYAAEVLGDPWDYDDAPDLITDGPPISVQVSGLRLEGGQARWSSQGGYVSPLQMTVPGALPDSRDGVWNPIDADRFTQVSMRIWYGSATQLGVQWFVCHQDYGPCFAMYALNLQPGWNLLTLDMPALAGTGDRGWTGSVYGLRLATGGTTDVRLDWLRVHEPGPVLPVSDPDGGPVYWDTTRTTADNTDDGPAWGRVPAGGFPSAAFPPGAYHLLDGQGNYGDTIVVHDAPRPVVLDPDAAGGRDYATTELGNPWDFGDGADVVELGNASGSLTGAGMLEATNAGPNINDPYVRLPVGAGGIDGSRYHRLTVTTSYDGPFSLEDAPGGGTHGRIVFWRADADRTFQDGRPLVTFTTRRTATYDLSTERIPSAVEPNSLPWAGAPITYLRWDPNEDRGARTWRVDEIRLAADDEADGLFTVRWRDDADAGATTVRIGLDTDRTGYDGPVVAETVQHAGENAVTVDLSDVAPGAYQLWVQGDDGTGTGGGYASGPLVVTRRLAGSDRVATALTLSRVGFPAGSDAVVVANGQAFPDALAGVQLAAAAGAPLVLNPPSSLDPRVRDEVQRLRPSTIYLLGGPAALDPDVETGVRAAVPDADVVRLAGPDRFATSGAVAEEAVRCWRARGIDPLADVLLASGTAFPDALAAGQLVAAAHQPLLLTAPDRLPATTADALDALGATRVTAVGGPSALANAVLAATGRPASRLAGSDRYATAAAVADAALQAGASTDGVLVALGEDFPDALAAGGLVARRGGTLVLVGRGGLPAATASWFDGHRSGIADWDVIGGRRAVADTVITALEAG